MRFTQTIKSDIESKLDVKDKKILQSLCTNARMAYTNISTKVSLSKDAVKYRIEKMEKEGIIQGYISVIDTESMGFITYHLFIQMDKVVKDTKDKIISAIKSFDFVKVIIEFSGKYDFEVGIVAKNIQELDERISKICEAVKNDLKEYSLLIIGKNYVNNTLPSSFMQNKSDKQMLETIPKPKTSPEFDKKDLEILNIISTKSRMQLHEIGQKVALTGDAIRYRLKKMEDSRLLQRFVPIINYSQMGYTVYTLLVNIHNLDKKKEDTLKYFLKTEENILWATKTIGPFNLLMYICVKKSSEFHETLMRLKEIFSTDIKEYEALVAYEEYEYTYFPKICSK